MKEVRFHTEEILDSCLNFYTLAINTIALSISNYLPPLLSDALG